jgi:hypothetical protein
MNGLSPEVAAEVARHVKGTTIAWGAGRYVDPGNPETITITIEDYAYALAYARRWCGQTRGRRGERDFYGVGEHCVRMAEHMLRDGLGPRVALQGLMHESDEVMPFGDMAGPVKPLCQDAVQLAKRCGDRLDRLFGITFTDRDIVKRYDIRMLVTERRDVLVGHESDVWDNGGSGQTSTEGYEPFAERIIPYRHPTLAAKRFLQLYQQLSEAV